MPTVHESITHERGHIVHNKLLVNVAHASLRRQDYAFVKAAPKQCSKFSKVAFWKDCHSDIASVCVVHALACYDNHAHSSFDND